MNKKGQALVEFVLILPIFIFLVFVIYDFGMIFSVKNSLEDSCSDIIMMYKNGKTLEQIRGMYPDLDISISDETDYHKVDVGDKIKLITPGFNRIFGNPYHVSVGRYVPYE